LKAYPIETQKPQYIPCDKQGRKDTPMKNDELVVSENQAAEKNGLLEEIIREGARKVLQAAIEHEVGAYLDMFKELTDETGKRLVVRHGFLPERSLLTGIGPLSIKQPRVRDKREGKSFTSAILPRYMRRVPSLDNLIPVLYLKGISTGDFSEALEAILGENAKGLSASTVVRLKKQWEQDFRTWAKRDLTGLRYVYFWADGIHFNVRLEDTENKRQCVLVIIGAREDGAKELVAVLDGYRVAERDVLQLFNNSIATSKPFSSPILFPLVTA
jgi:putative transposase